jgi:Bacterial aa3 type cytochrome c oxidase subunit IV
LAEVIHTPDPMLAEEIAESSPNVDYPAHVRTFNSVLSAAKWFIIHVFIVLAALYFLGIAHDPVTAVVLLLCSVALLIYGLLRRPSIRADVAKGLHAAPAASEREHVDPQPGMADHTA